MAEQRPSSFINMLLTLALVTLASAVALGYVYSWTKGPIEAARLAKQLRAINKVLGIYDNDPITEASQIQGMVEDDSLTVYPGFQGGELSGVAIRTYSNKGYTTRIWVMAGFAPDGSIKDVEVLEHKETPGLGSKLSLPAFKDQYIGLNPGANDIRVTKDGGEIDAISGATISSRAMSEAIQLAYDSYNSNKE